MKPLLAEETRTSSSEGMLSLSLSLSLPSLSLSLSLSFFCPSSLLSLSLSLSLDETIGRGSKNVSVFQNIWLVLVFTVLLPLSRTGILKCRRRLLTIWTAGDARRAAVGTTAALTSEESMDRLDVDPVEMKVICSVCGILTMTSRILVQLLESCLNCALVFH